jgi:hypothetical protein
LQFTLIPARESFLSLLCFPHTILIIIIKQTTTTTAIIMKNGSVGLLSPLHHFVDGIFVLLGVYFMLLYRFTAKWAFFQVMSQAE